MDNLLTMQRVLDLEAVAIMSAKERLTQEVVQKLTDLLSMIQRMGGQLVFCGVGKSGMIGQKLASTFSSLGLPSFFLHPVEALHGDLGRLRGNDCVVFISKSGATEEILKLLPFLAVPREQKIGLLGNPASVIGSECGIILDCSVEKEACLNNQAPTTSSTLALAMGDAMAVLYESIAGINREGYAINHPGGILGKCMLMKVMSLMRKKEECPTLMESSSLREAILEMTRYPVGACAVIDEMGILKGIVVEGDIRRAFTKAETNIDIALSEVMNTSPIIGYPDDLAMDALVLMENRPKPLNVLPIIDANSVFMGFLRLHDLLCEGFSLR
ncbi:MAG: hypothetical protein A2381_13000 [Bdellovibrionales bacterium RIFOXYB1_FULL_37_110]|nr:MAG: hypothetical protein A2181_02325 [Bdellovibrionales bacterium RIFOXYA1_FULL_38_20]OFZ51625.1 MAG: hypothetical protein A2417_12660 [Bdellovibrionales bacterium RIFOXYC1_FULL_37_79]OFZ60452.1 MAG: hypothetical protein A2381_13000 [Bdellovibrionales bacterium RIFOXYB1_FULL_37_110]OFZ65025.1 MAG: hypothetical protein A2577_09265 [Bdellovibrionales bacterium RIFOXYD1_FULL_36_51]